MEIEFSDTAKKQLKKLPKNKQITILKKILVLKEDPFLGKSLKGVFKGLYSLKVWPYRIVYHFIPSKKLIFINIVQHRQSVYKK